MAGLVETGVLPIGLEVDGVVHATFTLRPPTVQDNIEAVSEVGMGNPVELSVAIFARQLLELGQLKNPARVRGQVYAAVITTDLLRQMHPADLNELEAANGRLEKKIRPGASSSAGGPMPESPLHGTASAPSTP